VSSHIAIVSETTQVTLDELTQVAAALQKQVTRDFGPLWAIDATVDSYAALEVVPLDYWHVIIRDDIPGDETGIHQQDANHQPFALVDYSTNWSLTASHEIMEMLADPFGNRLIAGDSPKTDQGRVSFLVEVCDPCQAATFGYSVNGVLVSDFCTRDYFAPTGTTGARYSFTGAVSAPRQVLEDGYLTWLYSPTGHLWQLVLENGQRRFSDVGLQPPAAACLRRTVDRMSAPLRATAQTRAPRPGLSLRDLSSPMGRTGAEAAAAASLRLQIEHRRRGSKC
jgi:hypothetical protein